MVSVSATSLSAQGFVVLTQSPDSVQTPLWGNVEAASSATSSALIVIPVPAPTVRVTSPLLPPPVRPAPAVTPVMSPVPVESVAHERVPEPSVDNTCPLDPSADGRVQVKFEETAAGA